jgi:hypothetical protein
MHVRDDLQILGAAKIPHQVHLGAVEDNSAAQALRVDVVIQDEIFDGPLIAIASAE